MWLYRCPKKTPFTATPPNSATSAETNPRGKHCVLLEKTCSKILEEYLRVSIHNSKLLPSLRMSPTSCMNAGNPPSITYMGQGYQKHRSHHPLIDPPLFLTIPTLTLRKMKTSDQAMARSRSCTAHASK
jgi:hypothetical protein